MALNILQSGLVTGTVTDGNQRPLANLTITIYDANMREWQSLGNTTTDKEGKYYFQWLHEQLTGRNRKSADIAIRVSTGERGIELFRSSMDQVRFNASEREEINIIIKQAIAAEVVEFDFLVAEVSFLAEKVAIADLQENKEHQDVTFLSRELEVPAEKIEHLVVAHRLQNRSQINPAFFYALLRKNTLLRKHAARSFNQHLSIGINTEIQPLLYAAALLPSDLIKTDVDQAVTELIVSKQVLAEISRYIELLKQFEKEGKNYFENDSAKKAIDTVKRFVTKDRIDEVVKIFNENKYDLETFFEKISNSDVFETPRDSKNARINVDLGNIFGFGHDIIPGLIKSKKINEPRDIKKLAKLNKADWTKELTKLKGNGTASAADKKLINIYSSAIVRRLEKMFPTEAFAAQLQREKKPQLANHEAIASFFNKHEDFDLRKDNIDLYLKEKKVSDKDARPIKEELKSVQRIFKLTPHYGKTNALLKKNIRSAHNIVAMGETRFLKEIAPEAGMEAKEAKRVFKKAERINTASLLIAGELQDTMRAIDIAALETNGLAKKLEAVSKDFPNLKSLFKLTDTCGCEHCRSVTSPAAYLLEILQFIKNRSVTDLTTTPPVTSKLAKDVLFERRPDMGDIDLGCENANTPVKYIDLVCELLEEAIAPDQGINFTGVLSDGPDNFKGVISAGLLAALQAANLPVTNKALVFETEVSSGSANALPHYVRDTKLVCKIVNTGGNNYKVFRLRQTMSSAAELDAAPEYVNMNAYTELAAQSYAFKLPFDLNHTEARAYFDRFDLSRAGVMQDFQVTGTPAVAAIAAEKLGLTDTERKLITIPKPTIAGQQGYWNAPAQWDTPPVMGDVVDYMQRVDHFLDKTGLTHSQLGLVLLLKYIDQAGNLFIKNLDLSCDTQKKVIQNLDAVALDRLHRFLRLQKKTAWKYEVLDEVISQARLGNKKLDNNDDNGDGISNGDECLIKAAQLLEITEKTGIKIDELIGFYGEIPHTILQEGGPMPLYYQVFLNKAKNGFIDEGLLPAKVDGSQLIGSFKSSIAVCLQLKQADLEKLLPLLPDGNLTFSNLSYLLAAARLMKKCKLKADDFVILTELTGINITDAPAKTLAFIDAVAAFQTSPLKAADVKYMLRHQADNIPDLTAKIKEILEKLQKEYQNNFSLNRSRFDEDLSSKEQTEALQGELSRLTGIGEEDVKTFTGFIDMNWTSAAAAKTLVDARLASFFNTTAIKNKIDELDAAAPTKNADIQAHEAALLALKDGKEQLRIAKTPAEIATANALIAAAEAQLLITTPKYDIATGRNLLKAFLDALAVYQLETGKINMLEQVIAAGFKTDPELVKVVLRYAQLKQPAPGSGLLSKILTTDALIDTDPTHLVPVLPPVTEPAFPSQFAALQLLHKLLPLVNAYNLSNEQVDWFFRNNQTIGWFEWDSIPYATGAGQLPVSYNKYIHFAGIISLVKQFTPVIDPADAEHPVSFLTIAALLLLPPGTVTKNEFIPKLSLLTGYDVDDLDAIDTHLFPVFDVAHYANVNTWKKVIACAEDLRKLGMDLSQVTQCIKPVLLTADVHLLRTALKSRYDEDTWLSTLKEIMDTIRPQKRNALVAYLLATNPTIKDENDLYDYLLIDVEMESAMPSSRIVQAHGTVQLFVQRCLMGLEPKAAADVDNDKGWNQWKWMKNYRVWEANVKVFLYPENWIEPELRDDKSFLFTELENEIQQNELNNFTAEDALTRYLEKLDNIAFLEVMASWYQTDVKIMHVFARSKGGDPPIYYYRRFEQERYWTPWEKVDLDITGDHLLAFMRNNRLCLAWPVFSEEADPTPKSTIPNSTPTPAGADGVPLDKPKKKLKIQLAISELANKKWQPKKVSKQGLLTPSHYSNYDNDFRRDVYSLMYFPLPKIANFPISDLIVIFKGAANEGESRELCGIFNMAGCKGYPELLYVPQEKQYFVDFLPDFNDTAFLSQRYNELNYVAGDDLSVRNGVTIFKSFNFAELLHNTPGNFRISYPHQFTSIDLVSLIFQLLLMLINNASIRVNSTRERGRFKIPMGTLLPYFKEDSNHAYVIIPGFYKQFKIGDRQLLTDLEKRTASDVLKLIEDISSLFNKYLKKFQDDPTQDINQLIHELVTDEEFQKIMDELTAYEGLDPLYDFLIGKTGNAEIDEVLTKLRDADGLVYGEQFKNMYHPLICPLRATLYRKGIPELMKRETQLQETKFNFETYYHPNPSLIPQTFYKNADGTVTLSYEKEVVDFDSGGSYSVYNWELFFHIPLLLATRLTKNQRFEEAMAWFHYMFNPTGALPGKVPQKYWVTKPFYLNQEADYINQRIDTLLYKIADPATPERKELEFAIEQWRNKPFQPHVVARFRPVAYQKAVLMKYIDNLMEWGDYLFRQDTMESIVQATQMYILADKLLGPKPRKISSPVKQPYETYNQIERKVDAIGNALIDLENILPDLSVLPEGGDELPAALPDMSMLYFCIPQNDKMLEVWDRVADRLFKIRHSQNIDGIERSLALFAPPIDPGMLVRAAASGLDISAVLAGMNAPVPYYRYSTLSQKATELTQEVKGLGVSLLQALEKKDAEAMALLRNELDIKLLNAVKDLKRIQVKEAKEQIDILQRTKKVTEERFKYYSAIQKIISKEQLNLDKLGEAKDWQLAANITYTLGATLALIPDFALGVSGFGGSPHGAAKFGGSLLAHSTDAIGKGLGIFSALASYEASRASTLGGYDRRFDDWKLQERLAKKELDSIDKQITAAEIRKEIAETDLKNQELQIENARKTDEFMRSKFTNKELYDWQIGQISSVYFKAYQLAHDVAKKAERCYRFELGNDDSFISYGYWDSLKKGLQSAEGLIHDIKRMETSYLDKNKREYEITKHVSLALLNPFALVKLRASGNCFFDIPETVYDMDHPGQYFRRIKSVSISLPCIAGPYTSVSTKLSLISNKYRKNTTGDNAAGTGYAEDPGNDERFVYNVGSIQSIATSQAQNDSGIFELNFRDERYLPFEGTGADSRWRLELPTELRQFDYNTIADVIIHIKYTAREGGSSLKNLANTAIREKLLLIEQELQKKGLHVMLNMKHDLPNEWHLLKQNGQVALNINKSKLPYFVNALDTAIEEVVFIAKVKNNPSSFTINVDAAAVNLSKNSDMGLCIGVSNAIDIDTLFNLSVAAADKDKLEQLMMFVKYSF